MKTVKRLVKVVKNDMLLYILCLIARSLASIFYALSPLVVAIVIDFVLGNNLDNSNASFAFVLKIFGGEKLLSQNLYAFSALLLTIILLHCATFVTARYLGSKVAERAAKNLKDTLYSHIQNLSYDYHIKAQTGDLLQRCTSDVEIVRRFFADQFLNIVRIVTLVIFTVTVMLFSNVKLTLISCITFPLIFVFAKQFFKNVQKTFGHQEEVEAQLTTIIQENLSGIRVVKAFDQGRNEIKNFAVKNAEFRDVSKKLIDHLARYWSTSDFFCYTQIFIVLGAGVLMTSRGEISFGSFTLFNTYVASLLWPIRGLGRLISDMGKVKISMARIDELFAVPEEDETPNSVLTDLKGDIVFKDVCFAYEEGKAILDKLSFTIKEGETVAFLGATGSGKSTIMLLLLRLYDYNSGSITVNGVELRQINKKHLREKIGLVLQESFLFSKSIKDNIIIAKQTANEADIERVTKIAAVHKSISSFEAGYETLVGERGVTLSGGQKQRIAIARTLIRESDVLIFDDSLSAVDSETDAEIRKALKARKKGITTIIISQRINTLMESDKIFVMSDGKITDVGSHDELISRENFYKKVWDIQSNTL